jgi:hypothetical protein
VAYPPQDQSLRQMQRILQSAAFRNAHTLQQLFQFLVAQAYGPGAESLKEYTIGIEAFSRPQNFDPKTDTIVRVQTHRLRQKLKEYYAKDGRHDPILIEIPKGHYLPTFEEIAPSVHNNGSPHLGATETGISDADPITGIETETNRSGTEKKPERLRRLYNRQTAVATGLALAIFVAGLLIGSRWLRLDENTGAIAANSAMSLNPATEPVKAFWAGLVGNDKTPIIAHADAVFLLDTHNDLFSFPKGASDYRGAPVDPQLAEEYASSPALVARAGKLYYENAYLGAGDLTAVAILANLFGRMGLNPVIEAGKDLTPEDLKQHNVFLVGSSFQSYAVAQLNTMGDFSFASEPGNQKDWTGLIVDAHPRPGEPSEYRTERDPVTQVLKTDHALITVEPGVVPGRYIADFGGLDTTGSEGAVLFGTSLSGVEQIAKALAAQGVHEANSDPPLFQAVVSVRLEKGNEVLGASLDTVHPIVFTRKPSTPANGQKPLSPQ